MQARSKHTPQTSNTDGVIKPWRVSVDDALCLKGPAIDQRNVLLWPAALRKKEEVEVEGVKEGVNDKYNKN